MRKSSLRRKRKCFISFIYKRQTQPTQKTKLIQCHWRCCCSCCLVVYRCLSMLGFSLRANQKKNKYEFCKNDTMMWQSEKQQDRLQHKFSIQDYVCWFRRSFVRSWVICLKRSIFLCIWYFFSSFQLSGIDKYVHVCNQRTNEQESCADERAGVEWREGDTVTANTIDALERIKIIMLFSIRCTWRCYKTIESNSECEQQHIGRHVRRTMKEMSDDDVSACGVRLCNRVVHFHRYNRNCTQLIPFYSLK